MTAIHLRFLRVAVLYALLGMTAGLVMGISGDHRFYPAHAHINLVGWASFALYGLVYRAYPSAAKSRLAIWHFWLANIGALFLSAGIIGINAGYEGFEPVAGVGGSATFSSTAIFAVVLFRTGSKRSDTTVRPDFISHLVDAVPRV